MLGIIMLSSSVPQYAAVVRAYRLSYSGIRRHDTRLNNTQLSNYKIAIKMRHSAYWYLIIMLGL